MNGQLAAKAIGLGLVLDQGRGPEWFPPLVRQNEVLGELPASGGNSAIGSSNMDIGSSGLNAEVSFLVQGPSFVAQMRAVEQGYRDAGRQLTLEEWDKEPGSATFLDGIARLTSALK